MKLAAYTRLSKEGDSLETQRDTIEAWAAREGHEIVALFADNGVSGGRPIAKRPEGAKAVAKAKERGVDGLVVARLDRTGRDTLDLLELVQRQGVNLLTLDGETDLSTPAGEMMFTMRAGMAQHYRKEIGANTKRRLDHLKRQGFKTGGFRPFGWRIVLGTNGRKSLAEDKAEQEAMLDVARWKADGWSFNEAARALNNKGVLPVKGGRWGGKQLAGCFKSWKKRLEENGVTVAP